MDDLISKKGLLNKINAYVCGSQDKEFICKLIAEMPTIDAVEVVRCKDCVYGEYDSEASDEKMDWYFCNYTGGNWNLGKQFCSYGERKINDS